MASPNTNPDRIAAGLVLERDDNGTRRWLLLLSSKWQEWGFPKGHSEAQESPYATAVRECAEECGIALVASTGPAYEAHYRLPDGPSKVVYYFPATTTQQDIVLSDEHGHAEWCDADTVLERLPYPQLKQMFAAHCKGIPWP